MSGENPFQEVLEFWFEDLSENKMRPKWFSKDPQFDQTIRDRFSALYLDVREGRGEKHLDHPHATLALILALDQFPRHLFRNSPEAFATDALALRYARHAVTRGYDRVVLPVQALFIYLPFEHSENLEDQVTSVELFRALAPSLPDKEPLDYAIQHYEIIQRFGRFPHRNHVLGRPSTPAEREFLRTFPGF